MPTKDNRNVDEVVLEILREHLPKAAPEALRADQDVFDLGMDSMNTLMMLTKLQETFDIKFDAMEVGPENFATLSRIVRLISSKLTAVS
jgi:acyl carrier protein